MTNRDATAADLPAVDHVFRQSFCDTFAHLYDRKDLGDFLAKLNAEAWREEFDDPRYAFRIAEANEQIVGFAKMGPSVLPIETDAEAMELRQLYIQKGYHGIGIAHALMDWVMEEARSRGATEL